jgi:hypothetical protein
MYLERAFEFQINIIIYSGFLGQYHCYILEMKQTLNPYFVYY